MKERTAEQILDDHINAVCLDDANVIADDNQSGIEWLSGQLQGHSLSSHDSKVIAILRSLLLETERRLEAAMERNERC